MNTPAEPAPAPLGATYTITGTGAPRISLTIVRVELSKPPGVSSWIINARAPFDFARPRLSRIKSSTAGLILPSITMRSTWGPDAPFDCAITDKPNATKIKNTPILSVFTVHLFDNFLDIFPNQLLVPWVAQ